MMFFKINNYKINDKEDITALKKITEAVNLNYKYSKNILVDVDYFDNLNFHFRVTPENMKLVDDYYDFFSKYLDTIQQFFNLDYSSKKYFMWSGLNILPLTERKLILCQKVVDNINRCKELNKDISFKEEEKLTQVLNVSKGYFRKNYVSYYLINTYSIYIHLPIGNFLVNYDHYINNRLVDYICAKDKEFESLTKIHSNTFLNVMENL